MKIGILQSGHLPDEFLGDLGDYEQMFHRLLGGRGYEFVSWNVVDDVFPESTDQADGWLITGSKHGAYEELDWIPKLEQLVRDIRVSGKPMIGVCFGHQVIAQALGGKVEKYADGWALGIQDYSFEGETLKLNAWHQDQVVELPKGAKVVASNDFCANAAIAYDDQIFTVQAHPEFEAEALDGLIKIRGAAIEDKSLLARATENLSKKAANTVLADKFADVFDKARTNE
ncbi:MAG: type 1 glutamine amidotransferase [Paracoccaceae bacterium]|nr:type 1 glutamine amidotransferase [Paracoccaceae bacterium]MDG1737485.1 type 1 glutamine amidotransferase [Paracoccaceae bacterium]MDG2257927.1 type 1 glutamine amidotransferase [Paracoccaceae bacterium]